MCVDASLLLDSCSGVGDAVRIGRDVDDAEIGTEYVTCFRGRPLLHVTDDVQVKRALVEDQIDFTLPQRQIPTLVVATNKRHHLATVECPDTHLVAGLKAENPVIIGNAAMRAEGPPHLPVRLVASATLAREQSAF